MDTNLSSTFDAKTARQIITAKTAKIVHSILTSYPGSPSQIEHPKQDTMIV